MNIFEILSQGKGAINEENVSAFLAYLLNPNETHGVKDIFFRKFIGLLDDSEFSKDDTLKVRNIQLEVPFYSKDKKHKRIIDILIECHSELLGDYIIEIENKIDVSAIQDNQLNEEIKYTRNTYSKKEYDVKHFKFVFLTPNKDCIKNNKDCCQNKDQCSYTHISWKENLIPILEDLLKDESKCKISPINDYVKQTIRAFVCYINNINEPILKNVKSFEMYSDGEIKTFCLKQYSNYQVKLYKGIEEISVYSTIYGLVNFLYDGEINEKINTRYLGHLLINYLNGNDGLKKLKRWNKIKSE